MNDTTVSLNIMHEPDADSADQPLRPVGTIAPNEELLTSMPQGVTIVVQEGEDTRFVLLMPQDSIWKNPPAFTSTDTNGNTIVYGGSLRIKINRYTSNADVPPMWTMNYVMLTSCKDGITSAISQAWTNYDTAELSAATTNKLNVLSHDKKICDKNHPAQVDGLRNCGPDSAFAFVT
jgi:hypothetical protein